MNSLKSCSKLLRLLAYCWRLGGLPLLALLALTQVLWLQACGFLHAPIKCHPNATPTAQHQGLSAIRDPSNYQFGIKCQEVLQ